MLLCTSHFLWGFYPRLRKVQHDLASRFLDLRRSEGRNKQSLSSTTSNLQRKPHLDLTLSSRAPRILIILAFASLLSACAVGPDYERPETGTVRNYKELKGWKIAQPRDHLDRGKWWLIYGDPTLNNLESQVEISNQNIAAAEAAYRQAAALVQQARASLFPTAGVSYAAFRGGKAGNPVTVVNVNTPYGTWDIDVWGKIRRQIESNIYFAQASAADLAGAKLSAQNQLAVAYFNLRTADSLATLLKKTIEKYKKTLEITQNQYKQGTLARSDVITAEQQVKTTEAQLISVGVSRAQFEHAIALLIGKPPSSLSIKPAELGTKVPIVPPDAPMSLLERRPDIASAERNVAAQNAQIGVSAAAYFPDIRLSALYGWVGPQAIPIAAANEIWSIAGSAAETVFDGGFRRGQLAFAEAGYYQAVAVYRQTILNAFKEVEDQLSNFRILSEQQKVQDEAVKLARQSVSIALNEYKAGTQAFVSVVTYDNILLGNEITALSIRQGRFLASANLILALGGGWDSSQLPAFNKLRNRWACVKVIDSIRGNIAPEMPECL